jgi:hypothetical protein
VKTVVVCGSLSLGSNPSSLIHKWTKLPELEYSSILDAILAAGQHYYSDSQLLPLANDLLSDVDSRLERAAKDAAIDEAIK